VLHDVSSDGGNHVNATRQMVVGLRPRVRDGVRACCWYGRGWPLFATVRERTMTVENYPLRFLGSAFNRAEEPGKSYCRLR
jgi:hypothetical protein